MIKAYLPGGLGDNIMQIPFLLSAAGITSPKDFKPALTFYLDAAKLKKPTDTDPTTRTLQSVQDLANLLRLQPYTKKVITAPCHKATLIKDPSILNTDKQRQHPNIDMTRGDICWRNTFLHRCLDYYPQSLPWLFPPHPTKEQTGFFKDKIIITTTPRYSSPIQLKELHKHEKNLVFIGLPKDYETFYWNYHLHVLYYSISDFIEFTQILQAASFYIGTQTFASCLAESMKIPRIILQCPRLPDLIPAGKYGNAVIDEDDFTNTFNLYYDTFYKEK